ncbi:MAG: hypothetical protein SOT60_07095 [Bilifractor sp.]|nr:hypothetical protein [Lachnospiraceae bacterium]MDY2837684.1 hypothetical protein [Bilifractor sp.]
MLDYNEELKKFKPSLDVENVEEAIKNQDLTDIVDLLRELELNQRNSSKTKKES